VPACHWARGGADLFLSDPASADEARAAMTDLDSVLDPVVSRLRADPDRSLISHLVHANRPADDPRPDATCSPCPSSSCSPATSRVGIGEHDCPAYAFVPAIARTALDVLFDRIPDLRPATHDLGEALTRQGRGRAGSEATVVTREPYDAAQ
jgi:hypothetical protein